MTPDKTPSEAELKALLPTKKLARDEAPKVQVWLTQSDALAFANAVLAKWGSPVVAVGGPVQEPLGEPFQRVLDENRWELYAEAGTPQPTQAQAGAVPLPIAIFEVGEQSLQLMFNNHEDAHQYRVHLQGIKEGGQHA